MAASVLGSLYRSVIYFVASRRTKDGWWWKALFLGLAAIAALSSLFWGLMLICEAYRLPLSWRPFGPALYVMQFSAPIFSVLAFLVVVLADLKNRRDWLHWLGVTFLGGGAALLVAWPVVVMLFLR